MKKDTVLAKIMGLRSAFPPHIFGFQSGQDLEIKIAGKLGPRGISPTAADLLDVAGAVYEIDRQITTWRSTNPPARIELRMKLRKPTAWSRGAVNALQDALHLLGNTPWEIDFSPGLHSPIPPHENSGLANIRYVALFSGGLDSASGALTLRSQAHETRLVSYYKKQKSLQNAIAKEIGFENPIQWTLDWNQPPGPGRSFYFRSFLFLALAAVTADSWGTRTIYQFENGVLASAVPPTPYWMMTKHAHPKLHKHMADLFGALFGGQWDIRNPFLPLTKRECVEQASAQRRDRTALTLLAKTETCWYLWSNHIPGGDKTPGLPCGICVPCLLRRTALPKDRFEFDLMSKKIQRDEYKGAAFRAYDAFLRKVRESGNSIASFYKALPAAGRDLADGMDELTFPQLQRLFVTFSTEFVNTFKVE